MRVVVNGSDVTIGHPVQYWEELLAWLDEDCAAEGLVVSEVTFEGVGLPTFRDPVERQRPVTDARIDVWAISLVRLVDSAIEDAVTAAEPLELAARSLATKFRVLDLANANGEIGEFAAGLASFIVLTGNITELAAASFGATRAATEGQALVKELTSHVDGLIAAQAAADTVSVADILEYDVVDALHKCVALLTMAHEASMEIPAAA